MLLVSTEQTLTMLMAGIKKLTPHITEKNVCVFRLKPQLTILVYINLSLFLQKKTHITEKNVCVFRLKPQLTILVYIDLSLFLQKKPLILSNPP